MNMNKMNVIPYSMPINNNNCDFKLNYRGGV